MMSDSSESTENTNDKAFKKLCKIQEVAGMLGVSGRTIYRLVETGQMPPPVKLGNLVRWRYEELCKWIDDGCKPVK